MPPEPAFRLWSRSGTTRGDTGLEQQGQALALLIGQRWRGGQSAADVVLKPSGAKVTPSVEDLGVVVSAVAAERAEARSFGRPGQGVLRAGVIRLPMGGPARDCVKPSATDCVATPG
jgi:hypothetical protein